MASTYSPNLRIELIGYGEQNNTWGTTTNTNLGTLIEQAIAGQAAVNVTAGNVTLTAVDGGTDQSRQMILAITGTPGAARTVTAPSVSKVYVVANGSTQTVTVKTALGAGVAVSSGKAKFVYCNGAGFSEATTEQASAAITDLTVSGTLTASGTITGVGFSSYLASPPAIGSGTASTGTFTALTSTGNTILGDASADTVTINGTIQPGAVISGSSASDALRITQTGAGNALKVEDDTNPDSTPFVVNNVGRVGIGSTNPESILHVRQDQDGTTRTIIHNRNATGTPLSELTFITSAFNFSDNRYAYIQSGGGGSNYLAFGTSNGATLTEKMRIAANGWVGIGTNAPASLLHAYTNGTSVVATVENAGGASAFLVLRNSVSTSNNIRIGSESSDFTLYTNGAEKMRVLSTGAVGIGTATPGGLFHVSAGASSVVSIVENVGGTDAYFVFRNSVTTANNVRIGAESAAFVAYTGGAVRLTISSTGNLYGTAGATAMTDGFFYIPSAAGAPSGVPTAVSGLVPMYYDTTNNNFYVYNGAWKKVLLA